MGGPAESLPFIKMHGLGNDFVVLDRRARALMLSPSQVRAIADRKMGVGCDQLIMVEPSSRADAFMRIHNADGGEVEACGNATRCVASLLLREQGKDQVAIETASGLLTARAAGPGSVSVDMGEPRFAWRDIPLARMLDTAKLDYRRGPLADPAAVNMGNPHVVFFVADAAAIDLATLGPKIEHDPLFPARVNVNVAQVTGAERIRLRVWERGAGITLACGTGACATLVAAVKRGLTARRATLVMDGGLLVVEWLDNNHVVMTGPTAETFHGTLAPGLLNGGAS
jgi:diaminopimelate epimerase